MLRLFRFENGLVTEMTVDNDLLPSQLSSADWIDAQESTDEEKALLQTFLRTELPQSDDVEEIEASSRCFVDQSGTHIHALFLAQTEGRHHTVSVAFILQNKRLVTIREDEVADFRLLRLRARRSQVEAHTPTDLLVTILDQKVENHADGLEDLLRALEAVSHMVLEVEDADLEDAIEDLARLEDSNGKMRLCLMDTQRDISFLLRRLRKEADLSDRLRETLRDIETLMSHTSFVSDKINFLMDSTRGFINLEQNQIIKIFSIAAVVFLPPTLVASIYGMNFRFMPELQWLMGYPWALGLMVISGVAPYWFFKRKGWL